MLHHFTIYVCSCKIYFWLPTIFIDTFFCVIIKFCNHNLYFKHVSFYLKLDKNFFHDHYQYLNCDFSVLAIFVTTTIDSNIFTIIWSWDLHFSYDYHYEQPLLIFQTWLSTCVDVILTLCMIINICSVAVFYSSHMIIFISRCCYYSSHDYQYV